MKKYFVAALVACVCAFASSVNAQEGQPLNQLTDQEKELGFELLFDGNELSPEIWQSGIDGYPVKDGYFVCEKGGNLETKKAYSDFIFRFEFKLPKDKSGNTGLGIRTTAANLDAAYHGMEAARLHLRLRARQDRRSETARRMELRRSHRDRSVHQSHCERSSYR